VSRRASLPGAEELFRRTSASPRTTAPATPREREEAQVDESTKRQVAESTEPEASQRRAPRHEEKVTFYCTAEDLVALEKTRLQLRSEHGLAADRGRIVRAALAYVLEDFEARGDDSILLRRLADS
jgi:hypothetical protein